jgi:hypothetical protein
MSTTEEKEQAVAEEKQEDCICYGFWAPFPSWLGYLPATSLWQKTAAD